MYTEHLEAIAPFYREVLGLPVKTYEPGHSLWLGTEPIQLVLHAPEEPWFPAPYDPQRSGILMWLQVDVDLEDIVSHLTEKRVEVSPVVHSGQRDLLLLKHPEGRRLGLNRERTSR